MTLTDLTLTDFLLARIAEDEAALGGEYGDWKTPSGMEDVPPQRWDYNEFHCGPNRWKAECEAKRRIVEAAGITAMGATDVEWVEVDFMRKRAFYPSSLAILRALASVYADHPDFREEWAV